MLSPDTRWSEVNQLFHCRDVIDLEVRSCCYRSYNGRVGDAAAAVAYVFVGIYTCTYRRT